MSDKLAMAIAHSLITADVLVNCKHICELMTQSRQTRARLIHFSEGAFLDGSNRKSQAGMPWIGTRLDQRGIWAVIGCNYLLTQPNRLHNSLFVISDQEKLITRYDKRF